MPDDNDWECGWEDARKRQLTVGLNVTPAERLAWLEGMMLFAYRAGALPKPEGSSILRDAPDAKEGKS